MCKHVQACSEGEGKTAPETLTTYEILEVINYSIFFRNE